MVYHGRSPTAAFWITRAELPKSQKLRVPLTKRIKESGSWERGNAAEIVSDSHPHVKLGYTKGANWMYWQKVTKAYYGYG